MMNNNYSVSDLYNAFATTYPECDREEIEYMVEQWQMKYDTDEQ